MRHRRSPTSRVPPVPLRRPRIVLRTAEMVVVTIALILSLWRIGGPWIPHLQWRDPLDALGAIILQFCQGIEGVVIGGTAVAASWRIGFAILLVLFLMAWRGWVLARNARKPGPVEVKRLSNAAGDTLTESRLDDLSARLMEHLSKAHLRQPAVLPVQPPAETFLDLLGDVSADAKNPWQSVQRMLGRIRPKVAYRISGVLQVRQREPKYGITITLTAFALGDSRIKTLWAGSWDEAMRDAGCWAMAAILPVTRYCKSPPWRDWCGRDLPWELFRYYQTAKELSESRKFDDALDYYYEALKFDPMNPYLRGEIAGTQAQLGLYIDALDSYEGALTRDGQSAENYNARLWSSFLHGHTRQFFHHLLHRPDSILMRYRYAQIIGYSGQLALQWCRKTSGSRETARKEIRDRLIPVLARRYWPIVAVPGGTERERKTVFRWLSSGLMVVGKDGKSRTADDYVQEAENLLERPLQKDLGDQDRIPAERQIRVFFQEASLQEMTRLYADRRLSVISPKARRGVTLYSLRLWRDVHGPLRLDYAREDDRSVAFRNNISLLKKRVRTCRKWYEKILYIEHSQPWQDHYNAACVYAFAMHLYDDPEKKSDLTNEMKASLDSLQDLAIAELEEAARCAESGFLTLKQWWMLSNDPDLAILRGYDKFAQFEQKTYPSRKHAQIRPPKAVSIDMTTYDLRLVGSVAKVLEQEWHGRSNHSAADIHTVIGWLTAEQQVWQSLKQMCANQARHWPERFALLHEVDLAVAGDLPPDSDFHPKLLESEVEGIGQPESQRTRPRSLDKQADEYADEIDRRMGRLSSRAESAVSVSSKWIAWLKREDEFGTNTLPARTIQKMCREYAAAWQHVSEWFTPDDADPGRRKQDAETDLALALKRIRRTELQHDWGPHSNAAVHMLARAAERAVERARTARNDPLNKP